MNAIIENQHVSAIAALFRRAPHQLNRIHESDAEIIRLPGSTGTYLAVTTDAISEEIASGLYTDPYQIGWMTVMANVSDLAAVAAVPAGLLLAETLPASVPAADVREIQRGVEDACEAAGTWILGGDTNEGSQLVLSACALGTITGRILSRRGCTSGDILYASGSPGRGNAFAFQRLLAGTISSFPYQPLARLRESQIIQRYARCCMDTSDGVFATLDQLMRLNLVGFRLDEGWEDRLDPDSRDVLRTAALPEWLLLAGPHGEFELLFTVSPTDDAAFIEAAGSIGWYPVRLGQVIDEPSVVVPLGNEAVPFATGWMRNLFADPSRPLNQKVNDLLEYDLAQKEGAYSHVHA